MRSLLIIALAVCGCTVSLHSESAALYVPDGGTIATALHNESAHGTLEVGAQTASGQNEVTRYTPADENASDWHQWVGNFSNSSGRDNHVMRFGWNVNGGGGLQSECDQCGALSSEYEQRYVAGGGPVMERHESFVNPEGVATRFLSFMGGLASTFVTGLYLYSNYVSIGSGRNNNDPASLSITPTTTQVKSPSGRRVLILDDDGNGSLTLQNGTSMDPARGHFVLASDGTLTLYTKQIGRLSNTNTPNVEWDGSLTRMLSPDGKNQWRTDNDGVSAYFNNSAVLLIQSTQPRFVTGVGMYNTTPPASKPSTPTDLAGVIAIMQSLGMCQ